VRKAWLEWCQGTVFVSAWSADNPDRRLTPAQVTDFDTHVAYYAGHLADWHRLPCGQGAPPGQAKARPTTARRPNSPNWYRPRTATVCGWPTGN
jgi:ribosomal protein S12 methylthiotransferase accessory factor